MQESNQHQKLKFQFQTWREPSQMHFTDTNLSNPNLQSHSN